ncbi:ABC transporter substrate-binding protein [Desulfotruncus alcoholivorax]|uniref:ABC transporter substrate-binding protein n=1 Tax=Desulfotruncus alcoholivorax TaxID=265477 RepID=UPI00041A6DC9|nr:ABC transporter substrate-binding protein [Desulfotruncus alcoholivorax]
MMKKFFLVTCFILAAALLLAGCGGGGEQKSTADNSMIVVGLQAEPATLDPHQMQDYNSTRAGREIFNTLVEFKDESTELEPGLATSWDISEDGLEYVFHLRQGVKFHDGTPFNADAVKFSIDRQIDPKHPFHDTGTYPYADFTFGMVKSVDVVDEATVKITLKEKFAPFLANMAMPAACIVSPTAVEKYGKDFTKNPVGTGPYKFVSWNPGVEVIVEANPDYWGEKAKIQKIVYKPIIEDQARLTELESGNVDFIVNIPPDDLARLKADGNYAIVEQPGMHVWYTAMNCQKPPFNNVKVRQAVNYAINKESIVKNILKDTGVPAVGPLPPVIWSQTSDVPKYDYNPEKARQLLAEAGYPNGFDVTYWVPESGSGMQQPVAMATAIQSDLAKVGINVKIQTLEWTSYLDKVFVPADKSDMQMHQMSWIGDNGDPDNFLYILLSGEQWPEAGFNDAYYKNDKVDQLLKQARTLSKQEDRTPLYQEAQKLIMEDSPWVIVDHETQIVAMNKKIKGFKLHPTGVFRFEKASLE